MSKLLFHGELIELWCPMFSTINCKLLKEMHCTWIKPAYSEVGTGSMMLVLLCSSGVSGSNQTFLWRPVCDFKSWAGTVVSGWPSVCSEQCELVFSQVHWDCLYRDTTLGVVLAWDSNWFLCTSCCMKYTKFTAGWRTLSSAGIHKNMSVQLLM